MEGEGAIEELKSSVTKCVMCKVGKVSTVSRSTDKSELVIYGRNGMRLARHLEARCMVHGCRVGCFSRTLFQKNIRAIPPRTPLGSI